MSRMIVRVFAGGLCVLLLAAAMVAADAVAPPAAQGKEPTAPASAASEPDWGMLCILLGGGVIYIFRPRRRTTVSP